MDISPESLRNSIGSLLRLQEIDGQLFSLKAEFANPSTEYVELKKKFEEIQKTVRNLERIARDSDRERRSLELRAMTLKEDIKRAEGKRTAVRNTKEEFSAGKEVESFQKRAIENQKLLEEKEKIFQDKTAAKDEKSKALTDLQTQIDNADATRKARLEALNSQITELQSQRAEYIAKVDDQIFSLYERVQKLRRGSGVAIVRDFMCTACHVSIPPQLRYRLEKMEDLITCPSCSRILFPADQDEGPQQKKVAP